MLTIWGRRNSLNVQKVMWAVGELGLDYERHDVAGSFGQTDTDAYIQMNPNGTVPTIDDDGFTLWESNACVRYLAARYGTEPFYPDDLQTRARADQWMDWMAGGLMSTMMTIFWNQLRASAENYAQGAVDLSAVKLGDIYGLLDEHLSQHLYVAGPVFTMGDIPLGCATWRYYNLQIQRPSLPNVEAWYDRLGERPAYQQHVMFPFGSTPDEWTALEQEGAGK